MKRNTIFSALLLFAAIPLYSQIHSGVYNWGTMSMAADSLLGKLTGYYENSVGINEQTQEAEYTCVFWFSAKYAGEKNFPITVYSNFGQETFPGEIMVESEKKIRIKMEKEPFGCPNVEKFTEKLSPIFQFTEGREWKKIALIKNEKAVIYTKADETTKTRRYLVKGDCVKILEEKNGWVKFDFGDASKVVIAWLKKEDVGDF